MGPTAMVLVQPGKWTLGFVVNNVWSVAGHSNLPGINQFLLQYFINYNLEKGWYLTWQPTMTANWEAPNGSRWVVPLGGVVGRGIQQSSERRSRSFHRRKAARTCHVTVRLHDRDEASAEVGWPVCPESEYCRLDPNSTRRLTRNIGSYSALLNPRSVRSA